jgi:hypothetical protein
MFTSNTLNGFWVWDHVPGEGCKWEAICGEVTSTLEYIPGDALFRLTHDTFIYERAFADWDCAGNNDMAYVSGGGSHPSVITVKPLGVLVDPLDPSPCTLPDTLTVTVETTCAAWNQTFTVTRPVPGEDNWTYIDIGVISIAVICDGGIWTVNGTATCPDEPNPPWEFGLSTNSAVPDLLEFAPFEMVFDGATITGTDMVPDCCTTTTATITVTE